MRSTEPLQARLTSVPVEQIELDPQCRDTTEVLRGLQSLYRNEPVRKQFSRYWCDMLLLQSITSWDVLA